MSIPSDVARYAPIIYCDEREPFLPTRVGYSIITQNQESPSFQRFIELEPPLTRVIEYAIWFDWDIGHLHELEHVWVYLDAQEQIAACEASWHGFYNAMEWEGALPLEEGHPVVYAQPGKHAFAPAAAAFDELRAETERECGPWAGRGGLLIPHLYLDRLHKNPADDGLIRAYLQRRAFTPAWNFSQRVLITPDLLVPWSELHAYIPPRIEWWLAQLRNGLA